MNSVDRRSAMRPKAGDLYRAGSPSLGRVFLAFRFLPVGDAFAEFITARAARFIWTLNNRQTNAVD
jgi:hypothetical protein